MKRSLPFILALSFLVAFFYFIPLEKLKEALSRIPIPFLLLAFFFYSLSQVARAVRWKVFLDNLSFSQIFWLSSVNVFFNNVIPARLGELSWFYYAKKLNVVFRASLWSFLVGRIFDILAMFFVSGIVFRGYLITLSIVSLLIVLLFHKSYFMIPKWKKLEEFRNYIKERSSLRVSLYLFVLSCVSFLTKLAALQTLVYNSVGFDTRLVPSFVAGELSSVLPLHSFMGYGTYEMSFSLPLKLYGISLEDALLTAFLFHNFLLISSAVYGLIGLVVLHYNDSPP
ncbi:lysylphosphatidylglycerol synthase transmembrane domain-containing protein [Thermocrinis minervae]|uniref:Lysylphosphatidylglycerol synthase TM region n=1 Tax=Thermocrinis minervae TaxID=381751 RepID=A0A1M6SDC6_9AQUI|nr:lysylphosphatidylglycerol synthase transmembrane domain-containing protein [Thermocrinis minervae]SHK42753.1 hypothetical protein SAMN05444391_0986 [Thermocrinis minervae]